MNLPFVSIIVPVRNMERTLDTMLKYLMAVDYPRNMWEIILADGGSTDKTVELIKKYQKDHPYIKLIEIPKCPSPGFARTQALKEARGDFIFFTDGDCAPVKDWIHKMLTIFNKDPKIGAVGGEIFTLRVDPDNLVEIFCEAFGFNRVSWRYGNLQEGYYPDLTDLAPTEVCGHRAYFFVTANVAYRKEAVEDAQRKFWKLPTGEDMDFGLRVRKKGKWKFYFLPDASVKHMHRANLKALLKVWKSYSQAHAPLLRKHARNYFEIVFQFVGKYPHHPILKIPSPVRGFMYIGNFHLMHLFGALFAVSFLFHWILPLSIVWKILAWGFLFFVLKFAFNFFLSAFHIEPYEKWAEFAKMKYLTNLYFMLGGLKGSWKYRTLCIEPSF